MNKAKLLMLIVGGALMLSLVACSSGADPGAEIPVGNGTLYYLPSITQAEAERFIEFGWESEMYSDDSILDIQLRKEGGAYEMRMPIKEGIDVDSIIPYMTEIACLLESEVFDGTVNVIVLEPDTQSFDSGIIRREFCR